MLLLVLVAAAAALPARRAGAVVLELLPTTTAGVTDNPYGAGTGNTTTGQAQYDAFDTAGVTARLRLTRARSVHVGGYGIRRTWYLDTPAADNTSHTAAWMSDFALDARTNLILEATATLFRFSTLAVVNPGADPTTLPIATTGAAATDIINTTATQTFNFQPSGRDRYLQILTASYNRPWSQPSQVPTLLQLGLTLRGERIAGRDIYSLSAIGGDSFRLDHPAIPLAGYAAGQVLTLELLAGWRRDLSENASFELQGGPFVFYGTGVGTAVFGPSAIATASYRHLPWFATLTGSQQPTVNIYIGVPLIADSLTARLALPLDARETLLVSGLAGYTYTRQVTSDQSLSFAARAYDLVTLGLSLAYRFQRAPVVASLDYTDVAQSASVINGAAYPRTARRMLGLTITGTFAWGEGSAGLPVR
jgi:hypothetical protein